MKFKTLGGPSEGRYTVKMSRFLAFAYPVTTVEEAKAEIAAKQREYHDARHVCWAYMIGAARTQYLSSDNGEPSGTAGKPILGQINSFELTDVVIIVVRYFGGIKLGTPGLISAYREAARLAIEAGTIVELHERARVTFTFPYLAMNDVMRVAKLPICKIISQDFDNSCRLTLETNADDLSELKTRLHSISGLTF